MYFGLRITPEIFGCPFPLALGIVKYLLKNKKVETDMYITADEQLDKFGENTHRHFHFNFIADYKKDSLRQLIVRWFADRDYKITGNDSYALSSYNEPDDEKRWFRYCMKEKYIPQLTNLSEYDEDELKTMEACAKDERAITIGLNLKQREKLQSRQTLYDKLEAYLLGSGIEFKNNEQLFLKILDYYCENTHPVDPRVIDRYVNLYMLRNNLITKKQFYDLSH